MSRDLAHLVADALTETFDDIVMDDGDTNTSIRTPTVDDALRLLVNLAGQGVAISVEEFVDPSDHGIQIVYAHGDDCEGCRGIQTMAFEAIARNAVLEFRKRGLT